MLIKGSVTGNYAWGASSSRDRKFHTNDCLIVLDLLRSHETSCIQRHAMAHPFPPAIHHGRSLSRWRNSCGTWQSQRSHVIEPDEFCLQPESPRYLAKFGRQRVVESLSRIRNLPESDVWLNCEVDDVCGQYEQERLLVGWKGFLKELKSKSIRRRIFMITFLFIFFQFSGTNSVNCESSMSTI